MESASAINWIRVQEEELRLKGYSEQDITLLSLLKKDELPKEILAYYLEFYIHNNVMNIKENKELKVKWNSYKNISHRLEQLRYADHEK